MNWNARVSNAKTCQNHYGKETFPILYLQPVGYLLNFCTKYTCNRLQLGLQIAIKSKSDVQ
jgi:hypothetical protein